MPARAASILTTAVLVLTLGAAHAQVEPKAPPPQERTFGYYRCGPEGQELRDSPCPDGQGRTAAVPKDGVDPKEAEAAKQRTAAESRDLAARQRERERLQARTPPAAAGIDGRVGPKSTSAATKPKKPSDPKRPKPKDPKKPPKKKPKLPATPNTPDGALQPRPATGADGGALAPR